MSRFNHRLIVQVRNGEGVEHVMRVTVRGAPSNAVARAAGKALVNSPLVKTAVAGNDPNVGRMVGALGSFVGNRQGGEDGGGPDMGSLPGIFDLSPTLEGAVMKVGGKCVFEKVRERRERRETRERRDRERDAHPVVCGMWCVVVCILLYMMRPSNSSFFVLRSSSFLSQGRVRAGRGH